MTRSPSVLAAALALALSLSSTPCAAVEDLMEIYREAQRNDPALAAARANWEATQERVPQARAGLLPNVSLSASANGNYFGTNVDTDPRVARSEAGHRRRNTALARLLAYHDNLVNPVDVVLDQYTALCSIAMSCRDLALATGFLARHRLRADGRRLLSRSDAKRLNATMLTCGTYDNAGEFAYRVGLPVKSGVGGGMVAVVPNRCTVAVWGPGLDRCGNSCAGLEALDAFTSRTGWSVF